jgi:hypothetical protein
MKPPRWYLRRAVQILRARAFRSRAVSRLTRREHVLALGDSHASVFNRLELPGMRFRVKPVWGATASGLPNPNCKTKAAATFRRQLDRAEPWHRVVLLLGEVDCGFVIWDRASRHGLDVQEQLTLTLDGYEAFIADVRSRAFSRVSVLSAPLPTIGDDRSRWGDVANLRGTVTASQRERTELTLRFNAELRERCGRLGVEFLDVSTATLDPQTGLIQRRFVRDDQDHHLVHAPYAELIASALTGPAGEKEGTRALHLAGAQR